VTHIKKTYNLIAHQFSQTRNSPWPEFSEFGKYVKPGDRLLDLGCGNGRVFEFLRERKIQYTGFDIADKLLREAKQKHPAGEFILGDMRQPLPFFDNYFDHIWAIASFHHLETRGERESALREMRRVLKPGGKLVIMVWNLYQPKYWKFVLKGFWDWILGKTRSAKDLFIPWKSGGEEIVWRYYYAFSPAELRKLLIPNGFKIIEEYCSKNGERVSVRQGYNIVVVADRV
jgi:ubiquinone/menaquinone biosynthesis C-methylase UbiE